VGIPSEALPHIFDRFFRVDKARSRDQGGAGLGLSIVKSICTAHHGHVEAVSTLGQGSRFQVNLPLNVAPTDNSKSKNYDH
jgi:signal transduction histidine kinase